MLSDECDDHDDDDDDKLVNVTGVKGHGFLRQCNSEVHSNAGGLWLHRREMQL